MRKIALLLILVACLIPLNVHGENDPFNVNASLFYADFPSSGGTGYVDIYVQNTQTTSQTITVSPWIQYTFPDAEATGGWIQPEWIPSITPNELLLSPSQSALFSVRFTIPPNAPEKVFKTWIKVSNGTVDKPITIWVRKGEAVPSYDFSLTSGSGAYICKVTGYGASAVVDGPIGEVHPIGIRSKCAVPTKFQAFLMYPAWIDKDTQKVVNDDVITQERVNDNTSSIFYGKQEEVGNVYKALAVDAGWITLGTERNACTQADPLIVEAYSTGFIPWSLTIPDSVKDGGYWAWVKITPAEPMSPTGTGVSIDYISKIYIQVDRDQNKGSLSSVIVSGIILGGLLGLLALYVIFKKIVGFLRRAKPVQRNGRRYAV